MVAKTIIPALADLTQDIAGPIPVELIETWLSSEQTDADHSRILEPYKRIGTMVSSDSAGLSKLCAGKPLIEVMKLVSEPKEIIFAYGTAIGGKAIGIWAADNTQMFYDQFVDPNEIVAQMVSAQRDIASKTVQVGIGIHSGVAFEIGGGLYGVDAETIEEFTEEESEAGEVIVSETIFQKLRDPFRAVSSGRGSMKILDQRSIPLSSKKSADVYYPAPFDRGFHELLQQLDVARPEQMDRLHHERVRESTIVLMRIFDQALPRLLDVFTSKVAANSLIHGVCHRYGAQIVKSNGTLAIISCEEQGEGADLALALMQAAKENEMVANIGVSRGEVLIFDLGKGNADLSGSPVNLASKLAEDTSLRGKIFFEGTEATHALRHGISETFAIEKSGMLIQGMIA